MLKQCHKCNFWIDVEFNEQGKAIVPCPLCENENLYYGQPEPKKEVVFFDRHGLQLCTARDFETAAFMWTQGIFACTVNGTKYPHNDWRGRVAIEKLFGQQMTFIHPVSR